MTKKALGRGLDAFITGGIQGSAVIAPPPVATPAQPAAPAVQPIETAALGGSVVRHLDINAIDPNRFQPRTEFAPEQLHELANSIKQRGVLQPLVVRPGSVSPATGKRRYELIAGERRWRASREAGLTTVPALIKEATDLEALEMALIENLQRDDLNPIEEARAYQQLTTQFHLTQEQVADQVGRSRAAVANALRLLGLPATVQAWVADGRLSVGHAKAILGLTIPDEQTLVAERALKQNLTVRDTEQLVEQLKGLAKRTGRVAGVVIKAPEIAEIENRLKHRLSTQVSIRHGKKRGRIQIDYYGDDELSRLLGILGIEDL